MIQRKRNRKRSGGKIFAANGGSSSVGSACSGFAALSRRTPPRWLAYEGVRGSWLTKTFRWKTRRQAVPMEHRRLTIELSGLDSRDSNKDRIRRGAGCQSVRRGRRTSASRCVIPLFIRTPPGSQATGEEAWSGSACMLAACAVNPTYARARMSNSKNRSSAPGRSDRN